MASTDGIKAGSCGERGWYSLVVATVAEASGKRVAIIGSADNGHAHLATRPYGLDPTAAEYDGRMVALVKANRLRGLLEIDPALARRAAASYWRRAMLHGALGDDWQGELLSYEVPTYFGMLCAAYTYL